MNKKLIKTIASITCGLGIVGTIPAIASSCGGQSEPIITIETSILPLTLTSKTIELTANNDGNPVFSGVCDKFNIVSSSYNNNFLYFNFFLTHDEVINKNNEKIIYHSLDTYYQNQRTITDKSIDAHDFYNSSLMDGEMSNFSLKLNETLSDQIDTIDPNITGNLVISEMWATNKYWDDFFPSTTFQAGDKLSIIFDDASFAKLQAKPIGIPVQKITVKY